MKPEDAEEYTQALGQVAAGAWRQIALGERLGVAKALGLSTREWVEQRLGGYVRLSLDERKQAVKELSDEGHTQREIADVLGIDKMRVNRDLNPVSIDTSGHEEPQTQEPPSFDSVSIDTPDPLDAIGALAVGDIRETERRKLDARNREPDPIVEPVPPPVGKYRCIVIDPPWPMEKIERDVHPDQGVKLDYPTMSLDRIADDDWVPVRALADDDCHLYLWVTHKFLPAGMHLLEGWGFRYQCVMTWRKNVGMTPFSWMYDTEHVLFGRRGNLPLERLGLRLSFDAPVNGHSVKPDVFYDRVRQASPGPRVDMFPGIEHDGFEPWGLEASHRGI